MENINIITENSVGQCRAKSFSDLAHPCQAAPGVLCHLPVSGFRGLVWFWWKSVSWLPRCAVEDWGDGIGTARGEAACNFSGDEIGNYFFWHCSD